MQNTSEAAKFSVRQKRIFYFSLFAFLLFILAWTAGIFRAYFGFDPDWIGDNFAFNIAFLFPSIIVSLVISWFCFGLTISHWKQLPNKRQKILTLIMTLSLMLFSVYVWIMVLRQH